MARRSIEILGFNDLAVGDEWESLARTVTESDVAQFAALTGDFNPIHVDHVSAARTPFRRPIAHGLLGLSFGAGLCTGAPRVDTLAFLGILGWTFHAPIFFGDTIRAISLVESLEPRSNGRRGIVTWYRRLLNQEDEVVQEGRTQTLVRSRPAQAAEASADPGPEVA